MSSVKDLLTRHRGAPVSTELSNAVTPKPASVIPITKQATSENLSPEDRAVLFAQADADGSAAAKADNKGAKDRQSAAVRETLARVDLVINPYGRIFLITSTGGRRVALPINSDEALEELALRIKEASGVAVSKDVIIRELGPLKAAVRRNGIMYKTAIRCAKACGGYLVDLGAPDGTVAQVTGEGVSVVQPPEDILFLRPRGFGVQPLPKAFATVADAVECLLAWAKRRGVSDVDAVVLVAVLVESFRTDTPYPILILIGEAGSGKSELMRSCAMLIDPTQSGALADIELSVKSFAAASHSRYMFTLDNCPRFSPADSDLLCKTSTGAEYAERELYSQGSLAVAYLNNPVGISAVINPVSAPDMASRAVVIPVKRPVSYRSTESLRDEFEAERSELFGALLSALSGGMRLLPEVAAQRQWWHRLVSFSQMGEAIFQAAGKPPGFFLEQLEAQQRRSARESAGGDTFVTELRGVLRKTAVGVVQGSKLPAFSQWGEASGPGFAAIKRPEDDRILVAFKATTLFTRLPRMQYMPETERQLGDYITRVAPVMRAIGIECERKEVRGKRTVWAFAFKDGALDD